MMKVSVKKILSVVLSVVLLACTLAAAPFAADADIAVSASREAFTQGETATAEIYFPKSFDRIAALDLQLKYDATKLELVNVTMTDDFQSALDAQINGKVYSMNYSNPGVIAWSMAGSNNFNFSGVFAELEFKVKTNAVPGECKLTLNVEKAANSGYVDVTKDVSVQDGAFTIERNVYNEMSFELNSDESGYILTEYRNITEKNVVVPAHYNGLPVVEIGEGVFANHAEIVTITIPDTVTKLGYRAFAGCNKIERIELPELMTEIGDNAFFGCSALTQVKMPLIVEKIGKNAFYECYSLKSIELPFTLESIGASAFIRCYNLETVTISKNTEIGKDAFSSCIGLEKFITVADNENLSKYITDTGLDVTVETRKDISLGTASAADIVYTGEPLFPEVKIELTSGESVSADRDYKLIFVNNVNCGKAKCYAYGVDSYLEGYVVEFNIYCIHDFTETVLREATCSKEGVIVCKCNICGAEENKSIDKLPHTSDKWVYDIRPTVYKTGIKHKVCDECGTIFEGSTVAEKLYPDVNGDGEINSLDALCVLSYSVGKTGSIRGKEKLFNADTNADGSIDALDALNVLLISVGSI